MNVSCLKDTKGYNKYACKVFDENTERDVYVKADRVYLNDVEISSKTRFTLHTEPPTAFKCSSDGKYLNCRK
jgi:hypothetical protein